jgi:hypothetical protein
MLFLYPFIEQGQNRDVNSKSLMGKSNPDFLPNYFWIVYTLFSINIFFNIHTGLVFNYPVNGIRFLTEITSPALTIINSYLSIILYFLLLPFIFMQITPLLIPVLIVLLAGIIFASNYSYLVKGKVSLTKYKPVVKTQGYGTLQLNRSVNSSEGWKKWNRLSNNYFFYRKGFGTHANSNLTFDINKKYKTLKVDVGVDTESPTAASVIFQVWGDGKMLAESRKHGRFDFPEHLEVDVKGVKFLGLIATDAGDGINSDHADWLNPILYR